MFAKKKKREMIRQLQETDHKIDIRMLNKSYQMGEQSLHVLKDINFTVDEGEFVAILGPSGSGKSTLMNMIGCMDQWDTGEYYLDGMPVHALNGKELTQIRNEKIGFVFQNYHLIPAYTVLQNVIMPLLMRGIDHKTAEDMCMDTIRLLGLGERLHHKPNELSGGQIQRTAIARALINHPKIIFADEPTGNLDSNTACEIVDLLLKINSTGVAVMLITHDSSICSRILSEASAPVFYHIENGLLSSEGLKNSCNA